MNTSIIQGFRSSVSGGSELTGLYGVLRHIMGVSKSGLAFLASLYELVCGDVPS